jgi:serine protease Do
MNNPYDDFNKNSNEPKNNDNATQNQSQWQQNNWQSQGQSSTTPVNQTYWQGDTYHSSYQSPSQPQEQPQQSQQPYTYSPIQMNAKPPKQKKPHTKGKKTFTKVLAGVLCCLLISGGSIGGFTALINNGYITLKGSNTSSAVNQAFTATKVVNSSTSASTTTGQLTSQQIAKKVIPSVVCIENYQVSSRTTGGTTRRGTYDDQNGDQTGGTNDTAATTEQGSSVDPTSEGSGIIATSDGYIITNAHVEDGATSLKVITSDNKTYVAKLIGSDSVTDLAVIKIEATGLTAAEFGVSGDLQVADTVMAVGNPGGLEFNSSVTVGYVSALNREITNSTTGYTMKCIQTDAAINPGNSGGALVNSYGQVVGINSSKIVATGYEGLGFAIPIDVAQPVISELKQYGYVKDRAVLGITGQYIDSMTARFYGLTSGMYVSSVTSEAVTAAGIQKGDVITTIDGKAVTAETTITAIVNAKKPGDTVTLNVTRSSTGKTFTATVKLAQSTGK